MESLRRQEDFKYCYEKGKNIANRYLVLYVCERRSDPGNEKDEKQADRNRVGISVSKKVGNSVVRHRVSRLIRESYRLNEHFFKEGYDIVVIARASAGDKALKCIDISGAMLHLAGLHNILQKSD